MSIDNATSPAFPLNIIEGTYNNQGLTKREYIATMIIQGSIGQITADEKMMRHFSAVAVLLADILLQQLDNG